MNVSFLILLLALSQHYEPLEGQIINNVCTSFGAYILLLISPKCSYNPDVLSDPVSISQRRGYEIQNYTATTTDGYIITMFHILPKTQTQKSPIFLLHGFVSNPTPFVAAGNESLAFALANQGYDVWLGSFRGTTYANKNLNLTVNDVKFWNYTLDDVAKYDLTAQLEVVANETGKGGKIIYIGHASASLFGFLFSSGYPEEAQGLIQGIVALSPVGYLKGAFHFDLSVPLIGIAYNLGIKGFGYQETFIHKFLVGLCTVLPLPCKLFVDFFYGKTQQLPPESIPLFFSYWFTGFSIKMTNQYRQIYYSGLIRKYDYGGEGNLAEYGSAEPPQYNLSAITLPVYLFSGNTDALTTEQNVDKLFSELGSTEKQKFTVPKGNATYPYDNFDFIFAKDNNQLLYEDLFLVLENFA